MLKLVEAKLKDSKPKPNTKPPYSTTSSNLTNPATPSFKHLTQAQYHEWRAQVLYYYCDEKYVTGHRCQASKFLLFLMDDDPIESTCEPNPPHEPQKEPTLHLQLSTYTLTGLPSSNTLHFKRSILGQIMMVLVDMGNSHNILQPRLIGHLNLPISPTIAFSVMLGNGKHIYCSGLCSKVTMVIQDQVFKVPMCLLPIQGVGLVLGMQWLSFLGPITSNFFIPCMTLSHHKGLITLL